MDLETDSQLKKGSSGWKEIYLSDRIKRSHNKAKLLGNSIPLLQERLYRGGNRFRSFKSYADVVVHVSDTDQAFRSLYLSQCIFCILNDM